MAGGWDHYLLAEPVPGDVPAALEELGITVLRVADTEAHGHCPAHEERTGKTDYHPSWSVNTETGEHNCFSCGFRGPFVTLVRYALGCSAEDAVAWVRKRGSIERAKAKFSGKYVHELLDPVLSEAELALFVEVPEDVCETRDLDPEAVDYFEILWDAERELWITPIRDPLNGRLWGWQEKNAHHFRNYPRSVPKSKALFGYLQATTEVGILVESPLDCARLRTALDGDGIFDASPVSSFGVHISDEQLDLACATFDVLISALDNDRDGEQANRDLKKRVRGRARLKFWDYGFSEAKDPGEQSDAQIRDSYLRAVSSTLWRPSWS